MVVESVTACFEYFQVFCNGSIDVFVEVSFKFEFVLFRIFLERAVLRILPAVILDHAKGFLLSVFLKVLNALCEFMDFTIFTGVIF